MAIKVEHELHQRRKGRNLGVGLLLLGLIGIVFGLTVVKVLQLGDITDLDLGGRLDGADTSVPIDPVGGGD